jgi:hypothetical protein
MTLDGGRPRAAPGGPTPPRRRSPRADGRRAPIGSFCSATVFAIAITLLALDIRLPETSAELTEADLRHQLAELGPIYFSFVISFVSVGFYWIAHHRYFQLIVRSDPALLLLLNLLLLMGVAFIPFPTEVIGDYDNRTANIFYALVLAAVGLVSGGCGFTRAWVGGCSRVRSTSAVSWQACCARSWPRPASRRRPWWPSGRRPLRGACGMRSPPGR